MKAWVLRAPPKAGQRVAMYLRSIEPGGVELVEHAISAKRFHEARHAVEWASRYGALLEEFVVCRTP
jgi:hypothetical protein